jgi:hypothetical protein
MKWFAVCAVLLSVAVSVTEAVMVRGANQQNSVERKLEPDDYDPWVQGTVVYYEFDDGWYWGTITAYENGAYTTSWSDGDEEVFTDLAAVDQMVQNADDEPWDVGTVVYYEFDDGWYWGTVTAYENGAYTTTWSDGDEEVFNDDAVDQMVQNADDNAWELGTVIYYEFEDGWFWGTITAYDNGVYTTTWSDGDEEVFEDFAVVDQMVQNADDNAWELGTVIYYEFDDGWYWGTITAYDNGAYTTTWSDGDKEVFNDLAVVDQMVEDADDNAAWELGTVIYYEFDDGWYWGTITAYDNGIYTTTWSDGDEEVFTDFAVVDQMVEDADANGGGEASQNGDGEGDQYQPWGQGTLIYYEWPDGWYWGTITAYDNGAYTTSWSDGDKEVFTDFAVVDQMVEDASQARSADTNPTNKKAVTIGSVILVMAVFASVGVAAFLLQRRQKQKLQKLEEKLEETAQSTSTQLETDLPFIT